MSEHGDAARYRANLTAGYGDYASKGLNFYVNGEYQRDTSVFAKDRAFPYNTYDLSSTGGLDQNTRTARWSSPRPTPWSSAPPSPISTIR